MTRVSNLEPRCPGCGAVLDRMHCLSSTCPWVRMTCGAIVANVAAKKYINCSKENGDTP